MITMFSLVCNDLKLTIAMFTEGAGPILEGGTNQTPALHRTFSVFHVRFSVMLEMRVRGEGYSVDCSLQLHC